MLAFLGSTAIALAALTSTPDTAAPAAAQAAPAAPAVVAANPSAAGGTRTKPHSAKCRWDSDREAIEEQMRLRFSCRHPAAVTAAANLG